MFPMQGVQVPSLVKELRSYIPSGVAKTQQKKYKKPQQKRLLECYLLPSVNIYNFKKYLVMINHLFST